MFLVLHNEAGSSIIIHPRNTQYYSCKLDRDIPWVIPRYFHEYLFLGCHHYAYLIKQHQKCQHIALALAHLDSAVAVQWSNKEQYNSSME